MLFEKCVKVRVSFSPIVPSREELKARIVKGAYLLETVLQAPRRVLEGKIDGPALFDVIAAQNGPTYTNGSA